MFLSMKKLQIMMFGEQKIHLKKVKIITWYSVQSTLNTQHTFDKQLKISSALNNFALILQKNVKNSKLKSEIGVSYKKL